MKNPVPVWSGVWLQVTTSGLPNALDKMSHLCSLSITAYFLTTSIHGGRYAIQFHAYNVKLQPT